MRSYRGRSKVLRGLVACGGLLGLLLAVDAFAAFLFVILAAVLSSGPPNPYIGAFVYVLLPAVALVGLVVAWGAWEFWRATSPEQSAVAAPMGMSSR